MRIAIGLQYDGAAFNGWQVQSHGNTVQDTLERALFKFARVELPTTVAGRTDSGVHALGQVAHFDTDLLREPHSWVRGVNTFLPATVALRWAQPVRADFHARFAAFERSYDYLLYVNPVRSPLLTGRAGWMYAPLSVEAMRQAAQCLVGDHDFSAFRSSECQAKSPIKRLYEIRIEAAGDFIRFRFRANAFLHHMVRNIVGALIAVGRERRPPQWLGELLEGRDRRVAAPTFMPDGLYLTGVRYPPEFDLPNAGQAMHWFDLARPAAP